MYAIRSYYGFGTTQAPADLKKRCLDLGTHGLPGNSDGPIGEGLTIMVDNDNPAGLPPASNEPIPLMQRVLDNPFLLLFLGVAVPAVFYIIWGIIEITQIPIAE